MKIKTENIFQVVDLDASTSDVYNALTDEVLHARFTGKPALIDDRPGGTFKTNGQLQSGYNLVLEKNSRIVQAWNHKEFSPGFYTIVTIDLEKTDTGTRINFNHIGVPEEHCGWLTEAWKKSYWEPLKEFLEGKLEKTPENHETVS